MDRIARDLRLALRLIRKNPGFSAVAIVTLALAIGANTAVFSVVNTVLLEPLPYEDPDRLVVIWEQREGRDWLVSPANFRDWAERNRTLSAISLVKPVAMNVTGGDEPERIAAAQVSPSFFRVLGVGTALGRAFLPEESRPGADRVVVLAHGLWQRRFGGDPGIVGEMVSLDSTAYRVVGVLPEGLTVGYVGDPQAYVPRGVADDELTIDERATRKVAVLARVDPTRSVEEARADLSRIAAQLAGEYPDANSGWGVHLVPVLEDAVGPHRKNLLLVLSAVALLLLVACANLTNLILARSTGRQREIGLRVALGAGRRRLAQQLITETTVLAVIGGLAGLALAAWGIRALVSVGPRYVLRLDEVALDPAVLLFTLGLSIVTGVAVGVVPALRATDVDLARSLDEGGGRSSGGRRPHRLRDGLVVAQTALVVVLLVSGGLMFRSFRELLAVDPGFELADRVTVTLELPESKYPEPPEVAAFFDRALERIRAMPGVRAAGAATTLPLQPGGYELHVWFEGRPEPDPANVPTAGFDLVTPGFFQAMGIPVLRGRAFDARDRRDSSPVMMVNQAMAERYWPDEDAVGRRISTAGPEGPWAEVIGVVGDYKRTGLEVEALPAMFKPQPQMAFPLRTMRLVVDRAAEGAGGLAGALRAAVWEVDPDQPVSTVRPLEEVVADSISRQRFTMLTLGLFALVALVLGAVGIYGVLSYAVGERTREVGVRMALGARPADVLGWVLGRGLRPVVAGLAVGVVAALLVGRLLSGLLYGVGAADPATYAVICLGLLAVALAAIYLPARRATHIDPVASLRG